MDVLKMGKADFEKVPFVEVPLEPFDSLVIIPTNELHDSGWGCMEFVAVNDKLDPICRFGGGSDVIHIDGFGGYGPWPWNDSAKPHDWRIDLLPCGYVRLFPKTQMYIRSPFVVSSLEVFAKDV